MRARAGLGPVTAALASVRRDMNGFSRTPNPDPPTTVDRPWNSCTVVLDLTAPGNITVGTVITGLRTQVLNGVDTPPLEVRLRAIHVWELGGANVALEAYSLTQPTTSGVSAVLTQHDEPGRNHWACCSLVWPRSHQMESLGSNQLDAVVAAVRTAAVTAFLRVHVTLTWRTEQSVVPTRLAEVAHPRIPRDVAESQ